MEKVAKKKKSGWKWAFFLLLLLNMGVIIYVGSLFIASPTTDTHSKKEEITEAPQRQLEFICLQGGLSD